MPLFLQVVIKRCKHFELQDANKKKEKGKPFGY
jgi:hypothetical protein